MKTYIPSNGSFALLCALWLTALPIWSAEPADAATNKVRLLVVTGGHDFETNQFFEMFRANPEVTFEAVTHPQAHIHLKAEASRDWDVLVCYDMWQDIADDAKNNLVARLKEGKGLVSLHHSLADYQGWPEYEDIIGGRYNLQKRVVNNLEQPQSTYKHGVDFLVKLASAPHPITRGLADFTIHDETYGLFVVGPQSIALLTTDEPTSSKVIAWAKTWDKARVVYIQLGHDHLAYENPNYRRLVSQAIRWAAHRD